MIRAKKSLGQNFLISGRVTEAIAAAAGIREGETVLEIGPGKGALTKALLLAGAHVVAVEKDDRLVPVLEETFKKEIAAGKLRIIHGDVLETSANGLGLESMYKIVANIPYYITGALVRKFLSADQKPSLMILMVQKEVAQRIIARDGKESVLSISVKAYARPSLVMNVSRGNFFPVPNVDSAVIALSDIKNPFASGTDEERFFETVKSGFAQKRKKLASNLSSVMPRESVEKKFETLGLDGNIRAEDVSPEQWFSLADIK